MNTFKNKKAFSVLLISCAVLFLFMGYEASFLYAQESVSRSSNLKGFVQLDLSSGVYARTVVEDTNPGDHFEGEALSTRVLGRLSIKPWAPLELYVQAGAANLDIDEFDNFQGDYGFAYGGGIHLMLYENPGPQRFQFWVQGDTLHFTSEDHILADIDLDGNDVIVTTEQNIPVDERIRWQEYAIQGIGIWRSYRWEPYLGARFSWLDSTDTLEHPLIGELALKEDSNFGLVAGSSIYIDPRENFAVNFEVTLIDEASFKVGVRLWY